MSLLSIKEISKSFKKRKVVDGASFSVESGKVVGLLGPNGAGKTTSFYMVVGIIKPDAGEIRLDDIEITKDPMYERARVGLSYLAQEPSIFRKLTVAENIVVALEAHGYSGVERAERLEQLISDFRIGHIRDSYGYALSGGSVVA